MNTLATSSQNLFLTAAERARGVPIRDLLDAEAYRALGARGTTLGLDEDAVIDRALQSTAAKVARGATEGHRLLLRAWVRQGEASRAPAPCARLDDATEALLARAWDLLNPFRRTGSWKSPVRLTVSVEGLAALARAGLTPAILMEACVHYTATPLHVEHGAVKGTLTLAARGYAAGPAGDY